MTFEYTKDGDPMAEIDLNRIRLRIHERSMRAMYECLFGPALDEERAAVLAKLPDDVRRLLRKVFRTLYIFEPSQLNLDRYLSEDKTFIQDFAHYSVKFLRSQVAHENLFTTEDLAALPRFWSLWNQGGSLLPAGTGSDKTAG
jgi:hypothetical protein